MTSKNDETTDFNPVFNNEGLLPAMAIEAGTGTPLMMAYVNKQAIEKTLETGYAHFWSRSRSALWMKGETSHNRLKVLDILVDCDQDCLCFTVEMEGKKAACHTGRKSCFYRRLRPAKDSESAPFLEFDETGPLFDPGKVYGKTNS